MNKTKQITLLIGPSGAGKSTWARKFLEENPDYIYVSTDHMRMILTGDESNQEKNPLVFKTLENMVGYFMSLGKNLLIDATNYNWKNRKTWNRLADKYCYNKTWMVFKTSLEQCLENNQKRERKVPNWVIENQYNGLTLPLDEGGEIVYIIQNETL